MRTILTKLLFTLVLIIVMARSLSAQTDIDTRLAIIEAHITEISRLIESIPTDEGNAKQSADLRFRLGQIEEILRSVSGKADSIEHELSKLATSHTASRINTEARMQAIEKHLAHISHIDISASAPPQVLGQITVPEKVEQTPVATATITTKVTSNDSNLINQPLIGESPIPDAATNPNIKNPQMLYNQAKSDLLEGNYRNAQIGFIHLIERFPAHPLAGNAQYWLGETHYVRRNYKNAAEAFLIGYTKYAKSNKAPDSLLKLGMSLRALGESKRGCDAFAELAIRFPNAPQSITQRAKIEKTRGGCR